MKRLDFGWIGGQTASMDGEAPRDSAAGTAPAVGMNRRRFLGFSSCCLFCAAGAAPRALAGDAKPVDIGTLADFPRDGISDKFTGYDFFVIRREDRLYAATSVCPHMGNYLLRDTQDATRIICSGHESVFDNEGRVLVGPAMQSLARLGIIRNSEGRILVDPQKQFPEDQWGESGSYVAVK